MPNSNDAVTRKGIFALFKGPPNSGKSVAALSFPGAFVFDFDRKMPTVAEKHFPGKVFNWQTWDTVFGLSDFMKGWLTASSGGPLACPYETLIVDTVTSLSTTVLRSLDKTKGTDVVSMMQHVTKSDTIEVMGIDYYNAESNFFERWFMDNLKILWAREGNPKHVIVIAHEMIVESAPDLKTGAIKRTSSILTAGKKAAVYIPKCFDEEYVFRLSRPTMGDTLNKTKRLCVTSVDENEDARTCYNFPAVIDFSNKSLYDELNKIAKWEE